MEDSCVVEQTERQTDKQTVIIFLQLFELIQSSATLSVGSERDIQSSIRSDEADVVTFNDIIDYPRAQSSSFFPCVSEARQKARGSSTESWLAAPSRLFKNAFKKKVFQCNGLHYPLPFALVLLPCTRPFSWWKTLFSETCIPKLMTLLCDQPTLEVADVSLIGISPSIISAPLGTILHTSTPPIHPCLITLILMSFIVRCHHSANVQFLRSILEKLVYSLLLHMRMKDILNGKFC